MNAREEKNPLEDQQAKKSYVDHDFGQRKNANEIFWKIV
jgi:hypothetical protein